MLLGEAYFNLYLVVKVKIVISTNNKGLLGQLKCCITSRIRRWPNTAIIFAVHALQMWICCNVLEFPNMHFGASVHYVLTLRNKKDSFLNWNFKLITLHWWHSPIYVLAGKGRMLSKSRLYVETRLCQCRTGQCILRHHSIIRSGVDQPNFQAIQINSHFLFSTS